MEKKTSRWRKRWAEARALWDESALRSPGELPRLHKFAHFWVMVWRSFTRNRCPVRASALAYGSLLALIPMLAVVMSITSSILKNEGEERIDNFVVKLISDLVPPGTLAEDESETNSSAAELSKGTNMTATAQAATNAVGTNFASVA